MQKTFLKKYFLFTVGSVCSQLGGKRFADDEEVEAEMWMWLSNRQKTSYAAGFDTLVQRWDNCSKNHPHLSSGVCTTGQKWPQYLGT
jgi:hypothetical protein